MNLKEKLKELFREDQEYYLTSDFLRSGHGNIPERVIIKNDPRFFLFLAGLMVFFAVVNKFFYYSEYGFYTCAAIAGFFSLFVLSRSPKIILNKEGIFLDGYGKFRWNNIENTYIRVVSGDSTSWYIVVQTKGKLIEYYFFGLDKEIDEVAHLIEAFKLKYGNQSLSYRINLY